MRNITVISFITLDGVAQGPVQPDEDPSGGFRHSGWAAPFIETAMELVNAELMETPVSFLFGRKTYEMFSAHWPATTGTHHGDLLNRSEKYVVSSSLSKADWQNTKIIKGDVISQLKRIKGECGPRLQIHGSTSLIQTLIAHDLVDEFRLLTFPVVLGTGLRLFDNKSMPASLQLVKSKSTKNGIIMGVYRKL